VALLAFSSNSISSWRFGFGVLAFWLLGFWALGAAPPWSLATGEVRGQPTHPMRASESKLLAHSSYLHDHRLGCSRLRVAVWVLVWSGCWCGLGAPALGVRVHL
jgi:hypothetical protein